MFCNFTVVVLFLATCLFHQLLVEVLSQETQLSIVLCHALTYDLIEKDLTVVKFRFVQSLPNVDHLIKLIFER